MRRASILRQQTSANKRRDVCRLTDNTVTVSSLWSQVDEYISLYPLY